MLAPRPALPSTASAPRTDPPPPAVDRDLMPFPAVTAWIRAAARCRFNINPLLTAAGLEVDARGTPIIRRSALVRLMQQCVSHAAPAHHFPLVLGELFAFDSMPAMETFLTTSPSLRHAMPVLEWVERALPTQRLRVEEHGATATLLVEMDLPPTNARTVGYFVESVMAALAKFIRLAMGEITLVDHVELRHELGPHRAACEAHFGLPLREMQARDAVVFSTRLLDLPLPGSVPDLNRRAQAMLEQQLSPRRPAPATATEQLGQLFLRQPALLGQGIERVAERLQLHPRTLQRRLKDEGQSFGDIQARSRFEMAVTLLRDPANDIEGLSERLGFSDRHSFTRAFRRWTGLAPTEFRRQHLATYEASQPAETSTASSVSP